MEKISEKARVIGGTVFVGCMFLGMGLGWLNWNIPIGIMIGMGVGFLSMAAVFAFYSKSDRKDD